ncbi:LamG domain-containing protein [Massilia sp. DWR3-1-1]|uniref:LamG domain-containing protein n=1 Tax=Massilia sp. DWR3-1-1 TaxID=2804559 RepID=UPI003CF23445
MQLINKLTAALLAAASLLAISPAANAGLVALYTFDNAANLGLDKSGKGNNLVNSGSVAATAGVYGGGLALNGGSALLAASGTLAGLPTGDSSYSITAWINPTTSGAGGIVGWGNYGTNNEVVAFRMNGDYSLHNYWWYNDLSANSPTNLTTGSGTTGWHFVAATYDAITHVNSIYIDGVQVATRTATGLNAKAMNFAVGKTVDNEYFNGQMDNTAIFNQSLTSTELLAISRNDFSAFGVGVVPEPTSLLLLAIGAAALVGTRRRATRAA